MGMVEEFGAGRLTAQASLGVYGAEGHDAGVLAALICLGNMEPRSTTLAAGGAGVVSGITRPRSTTQAGRPRRRGRKGHAAE